MATLSLYVIRHGVAADRGARFPDDSKRPLTPAGIAALRKEGKALVRLGVSFDQIISSPLVRARQTAETLAQAFPVKPPIVLSDALAPAGNSASVFQELAKHMRVASIALVGHEPNLGELAGRLIGARTAIELKKGAVCRIDFEVFPPKGIGSLRWLATPKMLKNIG